VLVLYPELEQKDLIDQNNETLLPVIRKIRQVFEDHFDRTWFSIIIDGLPIDFRTIRIIREMVTLQSVHVGDEWFIYQAVVELSRFILLIRKFLLPVLKESLGADSPQDRPRSKSVHSSQIRSLHFPLQSRTFGGTGRGAPRSAALHLSEPGTANIANLCGSC